MRGILVLAAASVGLSGCLFHRDENPHNDVLFFGTTTKLAADVALAPETGGVPEVTVGYKRAEAVWMPLRESEGMIDEETGIKTLEDATKACHDQYTASATKVPKPRDEVRLAQLRQCMQTIRNGEKYLGQSDQMNATGAVTARSSDAYSVFASFGAQGNVANGGGSGGLAQVFATGIAAQKLASNPVVGAALNSNSEAVKGVAKAIQQADPVEELARRQGVSSQKLSNDLQKSAELNQQQEAILGAVLAPCYADGAKYAKLTGNANSRIATLANAKDPAEDYMEDLRADEITEVINECLS